MRIALAAVAGGVVVFIWGAIFHMVLPLGKVGLKTIPREGRVLDTLQSSVTEPGFYFFPGKDLSRKESPEEKKAYEEKYRTSPAGILVYRPQGGEMMSPRLLITELISNILAAGVAAFVVSWIRSGYFLRVLAVTSYGLVAWLSISVSYWNWYRFPGDYIGAEGIDQAVSWLLAGLVIAAIVRPRLAPPAFAPAP